MQLLLTRIVLPVVGRESHEYRLAVLNLVLLIPDDILDRLFGHADNQHEREWHNRGIGLERRNGGDRLQNCDDQKVQVRHARKLHQQTDWDEVDQAILRCADIILSEHYRHFLGLGTLGSFAFLLCSDTSRFDEGSVNIDMALFL